MKKLLVSFCVSILVAGVAQASPKKGTFTCKGNEEFGTSSAVEMTLTPWLKTTIDDVEEGVEVEYSILIKDGSRVVADTFARLSQNDVEVSIDSNTNQYGSIKGSIFLDELDQTEVSVQNAETNAKFNFVCDPAL